MTKVTKWRTDGVKVARAEALGFALFRAGELTPIHVPNEAEEAVRDLVRSIDDITPIVRHGRPRPGPSPGGGVPIAVEIAARLPVIQ